MIEQNTEIDHFIKEILNWCLIATSFVSYEFQLAYLFTKSPPTERSYDLTYKLGMIDIHSSIWGGVY